MNQEILEGVPTGRDPWSLAKLIPGVQVATYDVGGTQSMQQSSMSAHGSSTNDVSYNIDGATVNWPGGGGGATMLYYDQGMFEEVNYMTSAIPAEVMAGGVSINMVTKDGGNQWKGNVRYNFCQRQPAVRATSGRQPQRAAVADTFLGNPTQEDLRLQPRRRRRAGPEQAVGERHDPQVGRQQAGQRQNSDGSQALDDNDLKNYSGKVVGVDHANNKLIGLVPLEQQDPRPSPRHAAEHRARHRLARADQPGVRRRRRSTPASSNAAGVRVELQRHGRPDQLHLSARHAGRRDPHASTTRCRPRTSPRRAKSTSRTRATSSTTSSPTARAAAAASTCSRAACSGAGSTTSRDYSVQGDHYVEYYNNGVPTQIREFNTPAISKNMAKVTGFFVQDAWSMNRLTLNLGVRYDKYVGTLPDQSSPGGSFVGARTRVRERSASTRTSRCGAPARRTT